MGFLFLITTAVAFNSKIYHLSHDRIIASFSVLELQELFSMLLRYMLSVDDNGLERDII
jgi:hypothetical protein